MTRRTPDSEVFDAPSSALLVAFLWLMVDWVPDGGVFCFTFCYREKKTRNWSEMTASAKDRAHIVHKAPVSA